jgi:predicted TIM-barrel fold metal-dependent hydrolase
MIIDAADYLSGYDHVVFGSDTPYARIGDQIAKIDQPKLSENVKEYIFRKNIARILDIDAQPHS